MTSNWTLMASHGNVLFYILSRPSPTIREIASATELTDRRVSQIIRDLSVSEILRVHRRGRRNFYEVNPDSTFENPLGDVPMRAVERLLYEAEATHNRSLG